MFKENIKEAAINELKKIEIVSLFLYDKENSKILSFLYKNKIIEDEDIKPILEDLVIEEAKREYSQLTKNMKIKMEKSSRVIPYPQYPDHVAYPECFAYALEKKIFSKKEIKKIKFDHGETLESFIEEYSHKNLLDEIKEKILHPKKN